MGPTVEVTVRAVAAGGAGIADLPDGRVVFVPRTAPGDVARIRLVKSKPSWAEGTLEELVVPGPDRREPLCALYHECGGCQLQHLPDDAQLEWKSRFVADALTRIGGVSGVEPPEIVGSPEPVGYRSRLSFTMRRLRGGRIVAGFHALGRPAHVVDVTDECVLPIREVLEAWGELRAGWGRGARLLPDGGRLRLTLRLDAEGMALVVEGGPAGWSGEALAAAVPRLAAVWHRPGEGAGLSRVGGSGSTPPSFAQVNPGAAALLRDWVLGVVGTGGRAVDAYCGGGDFGRPLAAEGWSVTGIERDRAACARARLDPPPGFEVREGAVETLLPGLLPVDLVLVNPPRAGLAPAVTDALRACPAKRLVYVSCDPATLARDVSRLSERYAVEAVRCFDLFPQTARVETALVMGGEVER